MPDEMDLILTWENGRRHRICVQVSHDPDDALQLLADAAKFYIEDYPDGPPALVSVNGD